MALSGLVDEALAGQILAGPLADVLVAPGFSEAAVSFFADKRKNMRLIAAPPPVEAAS